MDRKRLDGQEGVALALALIASFLLFIITFEVAHTTRIEQFIANNIEIDTRLEVACQAGYEVATARLREDRQQTEVDSLEEAWASLIVDDQLIEADVSDEEFLVLDDEGDEFFYDEEQQTRILIRCFDESAKFNVYLLDNSDPGIARDRRDQIANVIDLFREDYQDDLSLSDGTHIADGILEFLRRTEDNPYREAPPPHVKKVGTTYSIHDLLYVDGIDPFVLYDVSLDDGETIMPGLFRFLTIWSDTQINLNTSPRATLAGLFGPKDVYLARRIEEVREEWEEESERERDRTEDDPTESAPAGEGTNPFGAGGLEGASETDAAAASLGAAPFMQINELTEKVDDMSQDVYNAISSLLTVQSNVFTVFVTAERGLIRRTKQYVVRRTERGFRKLLEKRVDFPYYISRDEMEQGEEDAAELADELDR